ncbi:gliding motility-associated C-terminal domain-containing protein, partial [Candidatus Amoebophilus asiaticus]|nr:gliding motility-associated C-terminal domain-containing protein [Candidatus Amoebophilus asiaticus]
TTTDVSCNGGADGSATVTASGGILPYTYSWSNTQTTATATNLSAGSYDVTVFDANGCLSTASVVITEPTAITLTTGSTDATCGNADGTASVTATGGTGPYTYNWSNSQTTQTATSLVPGTYGITVTDNNGCQAVTSVTVIDPGSPNAGISTSSDVNCNGGSDGSSTVTANGGVLPYTYSWSNSQTTATATSLSAGSYDVTVFDANGCLSTASVVITEPTAITLTTGSTNATCGNADGTASVTATGGTGPYTYNWSNSQSAQTATSLVPGTYGITVTDNNGCQAVTSVTVIDPGSPSVGISTSTDVSCNGESDGSSTVTANGGILPYTYSWSNSQTTATTTNLSAGSYDVTVFDANGCLSTASVVITEPTAITLTTGSANATCGNADGTASVTVTGGTPAYTYSWNNTGTTGTITNLLAGIYTVTVTDANGCQTIVSVTINDIGGPTAVITDSNDVSIGGGSDGSATVSAIGGTAPYTYAWSNGQTTATATNLSAGSYCVTITDANNCVAVACITINEPAALGTLTSSTNVSCNGGTDGTATVSAVGGVPPYTYSWTTGASTATITGLGAGTYTVTASDANGAASITSVTITEPSAVNASVSGTNITCNGACDGTASITGTGGTPPYTYTWSNGANTQNISNLCPGTYTGTITDNNNCQATATIVITEPPLLSASSTSTDVQCNGACDGTASITGTGGTLPYTYTWSNGANTQNINNLCPGTYTGTVTDNQGCQATTSVLINEPTQLTSSSTSTNATCTGACDGTASITGSGGTPPYTYSWSNGQTTQSISSLCAGTYTGTVTDANNCQTTVTIIITEPAGLSATATGTNVQCNGACDGTATITGTGGTLPYTYSWSNGAGTQNITNLCPGTYVGTIFDANGCKATSSVNITEPVQVTATVTGTNVQCNGACDGTASVTGGGGTPPYTYSWSNGSGTPNITNLCPGTYVATVTDNNGCQTTASILITEPTALSATATGTNVQCNGACDGTASITGTGGTLPYAYSWSNGQTTQSITNLCPGTYTGIVTDANGCVSTDTITITEPTQVTATTTGTDVQCNGACDGTASITGAGGTPPYAYSWSTGAVTPNINNLCPGTYTGTVTDANNCQTTATVTITEPAGMIPTIAGTNLQCNGDNSGAADLTVNGGTAPYTYQWSNGATTEDLTNIAAGTYTVSVTDNNGCQATASVTITEPLALTVVLASTNISCNGGSDGTAGVAVNGGTQPYTYNWSDGQVTATASNLAAGNYDVTVYDANGCQILGSVTITEPSAIAVTATSTNNATCNGDCDGTASISGSGGTPPYNYTWSNGFSGQNISGLCVGPITGTVTDAHGCQGIVIVTITEPDPLVLRNWSTEPTCKGENTGTAAPQVDGGTPPYTYLWSTGSTDSLITDLYAGTYTIVITDANGCEVTGTMTVSNYPDVMAGFIADPYETTILTPEIEFTDTSLGPVDEWYWDFGDGNVSSGVQDPIWVYSDTGTYIVQLIVESVNGCRDTITVIIRIDADVAFYVPNAFSPNSDGINDGFSGQGLGIVKDNFEMYVYDRWGEMIFRTTDLNEKWNGRYHNDGKMSQDGVYVYLIVFKDDLGKVHRYIGHVTLLK